MTFKELEDLLQIIKAEQSIVNQDVSDYPVMLYINGRAKVLDMVYVAENRAYNDKVLVVS